MPDEPANDHAATAYGPISWERMIRAVEKVKERLTRAVRALEAAGIPYAVAGGNAAATLIARVDESAVRNARDVEILLRRVDLARATESLASVGFVHRQENGKDFFLDGPGGRKRQAVRIVFACEALSPERLFLAPDVAESEVVAGIRVLVAEAFVRLALAMYRLDDRVDLRDLIDVGIVDSTWCARLPAALAERLRELFKNPEMEETSVLEKIQEGEIEIAQGRGIPHEEVERKLARWLA
ncbi:MAG: hypothetical protein HYS13_24245 [Planctomycetia bacterium]|nr:hypothetical protein [Planctomycetia bacterium]